MNKIPLTIDGHARLKAEMERLKTTERPRIIAAIAEARGHGDLSENAEYHAAKEAQGLNESRIAELEDTIGRCEIIDVTRLSGTRIKFGATVTLIDDDTEEKRVYQIVGEMEADVREGKISIASPIARALINREAGDFIEVSTPGGVRGYEISDVRYT